MIRSSKLILKYQTEKKTQELIKIYNEYKRIVNQYINLFYHYDEPFNTKTVHLIDSFLSSRYKSNACKQALEIVKSIRKKKKAKCPNFNGDMILDAKFIDINLDNPNKFDLWIKLSSSIKGKRINLPCRRHRRLNYWLNQGKLKSTIAIKYLNNKLRAILFIDIPDKSKKTTGNIVGCDIGYNKALVTSDNQYYGVDLKNIVNKIHRKVTGSNRQWKTIEERRNYINQELNKIDFSNIKELVIEKLLYLKHKRFVGKLHFWSYRIIVDKLVRLCQENCVSLTYINPAFTSQQCSFCGFTNKTNRKQEKFCCQNCGFTCDADYNASLNIKARSLESLAFH